MPDIEVDEAFYKSLLEDSDKLRCLEHAGVDNWEGYDFAMSEYYGDDDSYE